MIDHSEGLLRLRKILTALEQAMLRKDYYIARNLCVEIAVEARLVSQQVSIEEGIDAARRPPQA